MHMVTTLIISPLSHTLTSYICVLKKKTLSFVVLAQHDKRRSFMFNAGIAVVCDMLITTILVSLIMLVIWKKSIWVVALFLPVGCIELLYLSSQLTKFTKGGFVLLLCPFHIFCSFESLRKLFAVGLLSWGVLDSVPFSVNVLEELS